MKFSKFSALTHKWFSLFIGVQIVLWVMGGVVMSWFHITTVRGEHNMRDQQPVALEVVDILPPAGIIQNAKAGVLSLTLSIWQGRTVYMAHYDDGRRQLLDATHGAPIIIDETLARQLAVADFSGQSGQVVASLMGITNDEYRGTVPVWQVSMGDSENTHIYVSPEDGRVVARRNGTWRLYDFFWMLHIMDYENRTDFNNWIVRIVSALALMGVISGFVLLFYRFRRKDFGLSGKA